VFARGGTFEQCSDLSHNIAMVLILILEETHGAITTLEQSNDSPIFKDEK
jgi:hypothetical protein